MPPGCPAVTTAPPGADCYFIPEGDQGWILMLSLTKTVDKVKAGHGQRQDRALLGGVTPGQRVGDGVCGARFIFHREVEAE